MKFKSHSSLLACSLALVLAILPALRSDDTPPPIPAPAAKKAVEADKVVPPAAVTDTTQPASDQADSVEKEKSDPPEDSREKSEATTAVTPKANSDDTTVSDEKEAPEKKTEPDNQAPRSHHRIKKSGAHANRHHGSDNEVIGFVQDSNLEAGKQADAVISIFGSSTSAGEVGDAIVSILGSTRVTGGSVGDAAVAVLGSVYINGHVQGAVVAVMGNVELGPDAIVDGDVVCVGGELTRDVKATVGGNVQNISGPAHLMGFEWLSAWFKNCLVYARPLAFAPHLIWAWTLALTFLGFYALVALIAPDGVNRCVSTLEQNPGYSILTAVLVMILTPIVFILVALTIVIVIGVALIPILTMGLFFAGLFGKVVMLAWFGRRFTKLFGASALAHPVFGVLIGGGIVLLLYTVPFLGFVVYKLIGILGLGVVIYTLIRAIKSDRQAKAILVAKAEADKAAAFAASSAASAAAAAALASAAAPTAATVDPVAIPVPPVMPVLPLLLPPVISAATLPRAGFWLRLLAAFLDLVLIGLVVLFLSRIFHHVDNGMLFLYACYCVVMWATKGTTIGGIICGLKVVRLDDRPIEWSVAIIRGLGGFLSLAIAGLGFIWVAFDDERQSWHDKIAGTTIVRVPKGTPLL